VTAEPLVGDADLVLMDYMCFDEIKVLSLYVMTRHFGFATVVDQKGPRNFVMEWLLKRLTSAGLQELRVRTDNEGSILAVAKTLQSRWKHEFSTEVTPLHSHQSLGGGERYHRLLQEQVRCLKTDWQEKTGVEYPKTVAAAAWSRQAKARPGEA
jgi:hypothetical protein